MQNTCKQKVLEVQTQFELTKSTITKLNTFNITPTAKLVLVYLTTCYNHNKSEVFPKQKTVAEALGISERSVVRAIQELINDGIVLVITGKTNKYKFTNKILNDKLSSDKCQNVISLSDKLSVPYIEQKKRIKKEQTEVEILEQFAIDKGVKHVKAYVKAIEKSGNADKVVEKFREKEKAKKSVENFNQYSNDYLKHLNEIQNEEKKEIPSNVKKQFEKLREKLGNRS